MEKFVDKKIVRVLNIVSVVSGILWVVMFFGSLITESLGMLYACLLSLVIFVISSVWSRQASEKEEYTKKFMDYVRRRIDEAYTLDDFIALRQEFESLCIKDGSYTLSFPVDIKALHLEIVSKLESRKAKAMG